MHDKNQLFFFRSALQVRPKVGSPEAEVIPRQPNGGEGRDIIQEEPQSGPLLQPQQLWCHWKRLYRQRPPLLGNTDRRKHLVKIFSCFNCNEISQIMTRICILFFAPVMASFPFIVQHSDQSDQ